MRLEASGLRRLVAEVMAVEPDVRDVTHRTELEQRIRVAPLLRDQKIGPVEAAGRVAVRRRVEAAWHLHRLPARGVIEDARAIGELCVESLLRRASVGEAEVGV